MMRVRSMFVFFTLGMLALTGCTSASSSPAAAASAPKHIFFIMMENQAYKDVIGNTTDAPYINQLAGKYGSDSMYYGVTHPSLPNYLAAISGDFQGIYDDWKAGASSTCAPEEFVSSSSDFNGAQLLTASETQQATSQAHLFNGQTIVDQIENAHMTWKAYMQSMPSAGFTGEYYPGDVPSNGKTVTVKLYAQKHDPFEYFANIANSQARMQDIVPYTQFATDLQGNNVPNFVWISPDQCHDMHGISQGAATLENMPNCYSDTSKDPVDHSNIMLGDQYLSQVVPQIMGSKAWGEGAVIVIAWDEDDYAGYAGCCASPVGMNSTTLGGANAPLLVISSHVSQHQAVAIPANHYTTLATIEKLWGFTPLANAAKIQDSDLLTSLFW